MPRSKGSDVSQRPSPRVPLHLKTTACSEANGVVRHSVDRSPKLDDRRSPRSPLHEKKRGTRVADLETKLTQTQEEVKKLRAQLASAEAAKRDAQQALEETKKLIPVVPIVENSAPQQDAAAKDGSKLPEPVPGEESINSPATDVFEVVPTSSVQTESMQSEEEAEEAEKEEVETKTMIEEEVGEEEDEEVELPPRSNVDISELNAKLAKIEDEVTALAEENKGLRKLAEEAKEKAAASRKKEEEMNAKLVELEEELRKSKKKEQRLEEQVEAAEGSRETLEAEMKRLRVQTEQWRKAAEVAAAVLSAGEDGNGRRVAERCGSMHKHIGGYGDGVGFAGSLGMGGGGSGEQGLGGDKRRGGGGGGMKMFGELWKKKGQK